MRIIRDDLSGPEIAAFLKAHIDEMRAVTPPQSKHALDLDGLREADVTFWTAYEGEEIAGCGALKLLSPDAGEVKSMRTAPQWRRARVASTVLRTIIEEARRRGLKSLSLETGSFAFFEPARRLYTGYGFELCEPFAEYKEDPNSVFMRLELS